MQAQGQHPENRNSINNLELKNGAVAIGHQENEEKDPNERIDEFNS